MAGDGAGVQQRRIGAEGPVIPDLVRNAVLDIASEAKVSGPGYGRNRVRRLRVMENPVVELRSNVARLVARFGAQSMPTSLPS